MATTPTIVLAEQGCKALIRAAAVECDSRAGVDQASRGSLAMMKIASAAAALLFAGTFGAFAADSPTQSTAQPTTASQSDMRGQLSHATKTIQSGINELNQAVNTDVSGSTTASKPDDKANDDGSDNTLAMDQSARKSVHSDTQKLQGDLEKLNEDLNQPKK